MSISGDDMAEAEHWKARALAAEAALKERGEADRSSPQAGMPHPFSTELKDHLWRMYQEGQGSADHTARQVFDQMLDSLSQWQINLGSATSTCHRCGAMLSASPHCPTCGVPSRVTSTRIIGGKDGLG